MNKLILFLILTSSILYCQKVFINPDGYVTPIEYKDNILPPPAYSGVYEFYSPVEDEFGNYLGGDGYIQKLDFSIGASNQKLTETLDVAGWDKPQVNVIKNFDIIDNKFSSEGYSGYFRLFSYITSNGFAKEVECLIVTEDNFEKIFVKVE